MELASRSSLIRLYDSTAWYWDSRIHRAVYKKAYFHLFRALQSDGLLGVPDRSLRVLDCGIGIGLLAELLARAVGGPVELHGIDTSPGMLARAHSRLESAGLRTILTQADICALPFRDSGMDLVMGPWFSIT